MLALQRRFHAAHLKEGGIDLSESHLGGAAMPPYSGEQKTGLTRRDAQFRLGISNRRIRIAGMDHVSALRTLLLAASLTCSLAIPSLATAQEGVAGTAPVFTGPKKESATTPSPAPTTAKIKVESTLVTAPVTVVDPSGDFVYDLDEKDFSIFDNGKPQRITRFVQETDTIALVILVQTNDAVSALLDQVRPLGPVFSDLMLGPRGKAAVITFDDLVRVDQDFSEDSGRLEATLGALKVHGTKARLNDALERACTLLEKRPKGERRIVVAFSDGSDSGSETHKEEVIRQATNDEITIYGLRFNPAEALFLKKPKPPDQNPLDNNVALPLPPNTPATPTTSSNIYDTPIPVVPIMVATGEVIRSTVASSLLEFYAGYTGGVFYSHWTKKAIQDQLSRIANEIHSQYELAYVPDNLSEPGFHRIEVRVERPRVKVRTRAGYFYGGTQSPVAR
jgi:VWFA-related protein